MIIKNIRIFDKNSFAQGNLVIEKDRIARILIDENGVNKGPSSETDLHRNQEVLHYESHWISPVPQANSAK